MNVVSILDYWLFTLLQAIVAVPAFMCADAFSKFLPFCTGFAAGCMIWMVVAEVLPDAFKVICCISGYMNTWLNTFWIGLGLCIEHSKSLT
jgi:zinc transporter ZupT